MKIVREALIHHLSKIACGGQISGVVFSDAFATAALTPDQMLVVVAPPLPRVEALAEPIGVPDLSLLIKSLGVLQGSGNESTNVNVTVTNNRLVIDEEYRGSIRLMVANPNTIETKIEAESVKKLIDNAPKGEGFPITRALVDGIQRTFGLLKAREVEIVIGGEGESKLIVGNENSQLAEFPLNYASTQKYSLLFGEHFVDVLGVLSDFSNTFLHLSGPGSFAMIEDGAEGAYKFFLSPKMRGDV